MSVTSDPYTRRRRRTIELGTLACRAMGLVAVSLYLTDLSDTAITPQVIAMRVSGWLNVMVMLTASAFAVVNFVRPDGLRYRIFGILQIGADTAATCSAVFWSEMYIGETQWPMLAIPIAMAAQRLKLSGTLVVWAVAASSIFGGFWAIDHPMMELKSLIKAVGILLIVAILAGTQSNAYARQVMQLQLARQQLEYQATHDPLTSLPNRTLVESFAAGLGDRALAVLLLDLNGFKQVNDSFGHAAGDAVLKEAGRRLKHLLRADDLTARLGGDEFVVLLPDVDQDFAENVADRLRASICRPMNFGNAIIEVGVSIGISCRTTADNVSVQVLTAAADAAMYRQKELNTTSSAFQRRPANSHSEWD